MDFPSVNKVTGLSTYLPNYNKKSEEERKKLLFMEAMSKNQFTGFFWGLCLNKKFGMH